METKTLQEQMDKFYEETGYQLKVKDGKPYYDNYLCLYNSMVTELPDNLVVGGSLYLIGTKIAKLPDNLVVGGDLDLYSTTITELPENLVVNCSLILRYTNIVKLPDNLVIGGCLDLERSKITELPDNLIVGGSLNLYGTKITELPENLVVGGFLDIRHTNITKLPENLIVGCNLGLEGTKITELPNNLVVGGSLYLIGTDITQLPDNLVVGGDLDISHTMITELPDNLVVGDRIFGISNTQNIPTLTKEARNKIQKIKNFLQWEQDGKTYIKADGIFSVVDSHKGNVWITHRVGRDETLYVVTDGEGHYAHGESLKEAKADLIYKINDRDLSSYKNLSFDSELTFEEAIAIYRTITGACSSGTRDFIENRLPEPHKERYTIREIIELTKGEYGSEKLKEFFQSK